MQSGGKPFGGGMGGGGGQQQPTGGGAGGGAGAGFINPFTQVNIPKAPTFNTRAVTADSGNPIVAGLIGKYFNITGKLSRFAQQVLNLLKTFEAPEIKTPVPFNNMTQNIEKIQQDALQIKAELLGIMQYNQSDGDRLRAVKVLETIKEELLKFIRYCNELSFTFNSGEPADLKMNGKLLRHEFKNKVLDKLNSLKEILTTDFPQAIEHVKALGGTGGGAGQGGTQLIEAPNNLDPESLQELVNEVARSYNVVQQNMQAFNEKLEGFFTVAQQASAGKIKIARGQNIPQFEELVASRHQLDESIKEFEASLQTIASKEGKTSNGILWLKYGSF